MSTPKHGHLIYLAGPMRGLPDNGHPAFYEAEGLMRRYFPDARIFNPARQFDGETGLPLVQYLERDLNALLDASMIALLPGWKGSEGARIEYSIARSLDLDVIELSATSTGDEWEDHMTVKTTLWGEVSPPEDEAWRLVFGD